MELCHLVIPRKYSGSIMNRSVHTDDHPPQYVLDCRGVSQGLTPRLFCKSVEMFKKENDDDDDSQAQLGESTVVKGWIASCRHNHQNSFIILPLCSKRDWILILVISCVICEVWYDNVYNIFSFMVICSQIIVKPTILELFKVAIVIIVITR